MKVLPKLCLSLVLLLLVSACDESSSDMADMANPAAVFCEEQGGTYLIVRDAMGAHGVCEFPDGTKIDAWEYFSDSSDRASSGT